MSHPATSRKAGPETSVSGPARPISLCSVVLVLLGLQDGPGGGIQRILVLVAAGLELHLVLQTAVVPVQLRFQFGHLVRRQPGVGQRGLLGGLLADIRRLGGLLGLGVVAVVVVPGRGSGVRRGGRHRVR